MDDIKTLTAELARLTAKSDKCWAIVADHRAPDGERNAASSRTLELDFAAGKVAAALMRAKRVATLVRVA